MGGVGNLLLGACKAFSRKPAIIYGRETLTYGDYRKQLLQVAGLLAQAGLKPGDRVAVISRNLPEYLVIFGAAEVAGYVVVPVNFRLTAEEVLYVLKHSGAVAVFLEGAALVELGREIRPQAPDVRLWVSIGDGIVAGYVNWSHWLESGQSEPPGWPVHENQPAYIFYTSGTTGRPKGAILPHQGQIGNVLVQAAELGLAREDRVLLVMPLHHVGGKWLSLVTLIRGATLIVFSTFDPEAVVKSASEQQITVTLMAPTMIYRMLKTEGLDLKRLQSLKTILYSSAPMAPDLLKEGIQVFGPIFAQVYGSTESGCVTWFTKSEHERAFSSAEYGRLASAGRPALGVDLMIVDDHDNAVEPGKQGEVCVLAPWVFAGYWRNEEATRAAFLNGWLRMGDVGRIDEEGYVYILDRKNDLIITGGENVYPSAVEVALLSHPEIEEAGVVGVPDIEWGEKVKAFVVLKDGSRLGPKDVTDFCRGRLGGHKCPREVQFVRELPKNSVGKVLRRKLRENQA